MAGLLVNIDVPDHGFCLIEFNAQGYDALVR